ncbi:MAG: peptidylprolyl isomerase [Mariprofundaceae bacterium]
MQVATHKAVSIHYTLTNQTGDVVDSSRDGDPLAYIHGVGALVPGLEKEMEGKASGDNVVVTVQPEDGYGVRSPELIQSVPKAAFQFDGEIEVGMRFEAETDHGIELVEVVEVDDETVTIDANHPLAGETLNFDVNVVDVRDATDEELEHGHIHSSGGCQH